MIPKYRITHTRKDGNDLDRRIDAIMVNGRIIPIEQAFRLAESGQASFYTIVNGIVAAVFPRVHWWTKRGFLTTAPDQFGPNNLLRLPDC